MTRFHVDIDADFYEDFSEDGKNPYRGEVDIAARGKLVDFSPRTHYVGLSKADALAIGQALIDAANELPDPPDPPDPFPFEDGDIVKGGAYSLVVVRNGRIEWFDGERYSLAEPDPSHFTKVGRLND